jgi:hypothetical protein
VRSRSSSREPDPINAGLDTERCETLVRRLEKRARQDPQGYRRRVALLTALGFGYLAEKDVPPHPGVPALLIVGLRVHRPM